MSRDLPGGSCRPGAPMWPTSVTQSAAPGGQARVFSPSPHQKALCQHRLPCRGLGPGKPRPSHQAGHDRYLEVLFPELGTKARAPSGKANPLVHTLCGKVAPAAPLASQPSAGWGTRRRSHRHAHWGAIGHPLPILGPWAPAISLCPSGKYSTLSSPGTALFD